MTTIEEQIVAVEAEWAAASEISTAAAEKTRAIYQRRDDLITKLWKSRKKSGWTPQNTDDWSALGEAAYDNTEAYNLQMKLLAGFDKHLKSGGTYNPENWMSSVDITLARDEDVSSTADGIRRMVRSFGLDQFKFGVFSYHLSSDGIREVEYRAVDDMARFGMTTYGRDKWDEWQPLEDVLRYVARVAYYPGDD